MSTTFSVFKVGSLSNGHNKNKNLALFVECLKSPESQDYRKYHKCIVGFVNFSICDYVYL